MPEQKQPEPFEAFSSLVLSHQRAVFALAYARLRNVQDAEDVVQEVFAEACRKMSKLSTHEHALGWLMKATNFRCKDHARNSWRRRKRESSYVDILNGAAVHTGEEDLSERLLEVIAKLPEKYRMLLMLKHFARLSYADISRMTGLSKTTIDGRLRIAKKDLKARLQEEEGADSNEYLQRQ